jgi:hypothetical protein
MRAMNSQDFETSTLDEALALRAGLLAWKAQDRFVDRRALAKAMRDNWDRRIGRAKFDGVWSLAQARANPHHPASREALAIDRSNWTGSNVTVEHAVPIRVLYDAFIVASNRSAMAAVVEAYHVAVVTKEEDRRLRKAGLVSKMPNGWTWGDDPFARWQEVGIFVT